MSTEVLLVDDDPADQELVRRALSTGEYAVNLNTASSGEEALDYLQGRGRYADYDNRPFPDLILLDLNMPRLSGQEVLKTIRSTPSLAHLAVIILSTTEQESDVLQSYQLGCQSFITKPTSLIALTDALNELGRYWFRLVTLPPRQT